MPTKARSQVYTSVGDGSVWQLAEDDNEKEWDDSDEEMGRGLWLWMAG